MKSKLVGISRLAIASERCAFVFNITWLAADGSVANSVVHDFEELKEWLNERKDME